MGNNIRSSSRPKALAPSVPMPPLADAMDAVHLSVEWPGHGFVTGRAKR